MKRALAILAASAFALAAVGANAAQHGQDQSGMAAGDGSQPGGMMGRGGMGHGMMLKMMLAMMDTNNDRALSLEEVQAAHARMFNMADGDDDGQLTVEEFQGFMQSDGMAASQTR